MSMLFKDFYEKLFSCMESENLLYSVVRNYESLPSAKPGGDIDMLIEKDKVQNILSLIEAIIIPYEGRVEITSIRQYVVKLRIHNVNDNYTNKPVTELDLITRLSWKGQSWLCEKSVLQQSVKNDKSIYIPAMHHELEMSLFHSLLYGGFVKDGYQEKINKLFFKSDTSLLKEELFKNFGFKTGKFIFKNIELSHWKTLEENVSVIQKSLIFKNIKVNNVFSFIRMIEHYYLEFKIRLKQRRKKSLVISFLGPDGSGKSTIINALQNRKLPFKENKYFHLKPRLLKTNSTKSAVINPHGEKSHNIIMSYIKLLYFISDYILGYILMVLPLRVKSTLIIFDRYYDDILIDPKRFRYNGSLLFANFLRKLIPKPDIYFILIAEAEVIYKRKQEVTFKELQRQLKGYIQLEDNNRYILVNVDRSIDEIVNKIESDIYWRISEKY